MAIGTNDTIEKFDTLDDLDSTSAAVSNNAYSVAGDLAQWTNDDDAPLAVMVGLFTFSVAPTASTTIDLFCRPMNIADTSKEPDTPNDDIPQIYLGSFVLDNVTTEQVIPVSGGAVHLPNVYTSQLYEFYIKNNGTGQSLSSGWSLQITPKTFGPHA